MTDVKLENIINHKVAILALLMKRQVFKILADNNLEITPDQWVVMYYLWEENGLSIGEIARRSKKDFANVTRIVDKLEKRKYVTRRKSKKDSRSYNVFILKKTEKIKKEIQNIWKQASDIALSGISISEQKQLMRILTKIENNVLKNLDEDFEPTKTNE